MGDDRSALSRFDFAFIPAGPAQSTVDLAVLGEELGYRGMWIPDQGFHRDPFVLLALAAAATSRMALGVGITSPFTRSPVQIARAAGVIDEVAQHRFRLGLGTANVVHVVRPMGLRFERPVGRLRDAIHIIRALLAGQNVSFDGQEDHINGIQLEFETHPNIPIYVGTRGPQTLELAGRMADGVLVESLFAGEGLPHVISCITAGTARAGRESHAVDVVSWQIVIVTDEPTRVIDAHRPWIARALQVGPPEAMERIGIAPDVIERVADAMNRGDRESAIAGVTDDAIRALMVIGTADQVIQQIGEIFGRGADSVCVLGITDPAATADNLTRFAREVMPAFR
ncbi:MAG: LLM class flavin-dependent oxidoreductase [Chloroflexota bacterium]|nr:MAG: hypothetical protein DLM70_03440 [Chloroflexota bacterium]